VPETTFCGVTVIHNDGSDPDERVCVVFLIFILKSRQGKCQILRIIF
jgi:hypothetical protein